jgi:hypothetical protein
MTTSSTRARHVRSTTGKILVVVALASAIGGLSIGPAFGQDRGWRQEQQDHRWRQEQQDRGRHQRSWRDDRGRRVYRPVYAPPVYAPPPVVYVPAPSVGVHLFFPLFR